VILRIFCDHHGSAMGLFVDIKSQGLGISGRLMLSFGKFRLRTLKLFIDSSQVIKKRKFCPF